MTLSRLAAPALIVTVLFQAPAAAQLKGESSDGMTRTCTYQPSFSSRAQGGVLDRFVRIGAGEPCPSTYPGEKKQGEKPVPSFATLKQQVRERGRLMCVYTYLGQNYRREAPPSGGCAMTPD